MSIVTSQIWGEHAIDILLESRFILRILDNQVDSLYIRIFLQLYVLI